jgi:hypothetical protein
MIDEINQKDYRDSITSRVKELNLVRGFIFKPSVIGKSYEIYLVGDGKGGVDLEIFVSGSQDELSDKLKRTVKDSFIEKIGGKNQFYKMWFEIKDYQIFMLYNF